MKISSVRLEYAEGGFILSWEEMSGSGSTYSPMSYQSKKRVFTKDQGAEAIEELCELSDPEHHESMKEEQAEGE